MVGPRQGIGLRQLRCSALAVWIQPCYVRQRGRATIRLDPSPNRLTLSARRSSKALRPSEANAELANFWSTSHRHSTECARIRFQECTEQRRGRQGRSVPATQVCVQSFVESGFHHSRGRYDARAIERRENTRTQGGSMLTETAIEPRVKPAPRRSTMKAAVFVAPGACDAC